MLLLMIIQAFFAKKCFSLTVNKNLALFLRLSSLLYTVKYRIAAASELELLPIYSRKNQVIPKEKFNNDRSRLTAATTLVCAAAVAGTCTRTLSCSLQDALSDLLASNI